MRPKLLGFPLLASFAFLTAVGSVFLVAILFAGSALHGEMIGGVLGVLAAPLFAMAGSIVLLLAVAIPFSAFALWVFRKTKWREGYRWLLIPLTGPMFFCVLAPAIFLLGEPDVFGTAVLSFQLGAVVSTYWLSYLLFDLRFRKRRASQSVPETLGEKSPQMDHPRE